MTNDKKTEIDFIKEIEFLLLSKKKNNNDDNQLVIVDLKLNENNTDNDRKIIRTYVDKLKTSSPSWKKFEYAFLLYECMRQYQSYYQDGRKKFLDDMDNKNGYQIIKKVLRIYHFFDYLFSNSCYDAHKNCTLSVQDFYILKEDDWKSVANKYGFFKGFDDDSSYWNRNWKRNSTILNLKQPQVVNWRNTILASENSSCNTGNFSGTIRATHQAQQTKNQSSIVELPSIEKLFSKEDWYKMFHY